MPRAPARYCGHPTCNRKVKADFCFAHREPKETRPSSTERGYDNRWRKLAALFLRRNPFCQSRHPSPVRAKHVDHIVPLRDGGTHDVRNLQALCGSCHSRKTASEDGGFGNPRKKK